MITGTVPKFSIVWADNFYTSYKIAADLFEKNIGLVGTIRMDRIGLDRD